MAKTRSRWNAIVISGGRASRLGGINKTALRYRGRSLLDLALDAVEGAESVALVGDVNGVTGRPNVAATIWEDPRFGGPVPAIDTGLLVLGEEFPPEWTVVLAADLVRAPEALTLVLAARSAADRAVARSTSVSPPGTDGVIAVDDDGRRQPLLAAYRTRSLERAVARLRRDGRLPGRSLRELLAEMSLRDVAVPSELCRDVDTPDDAAELGIRLDSTPQHDTDGSQGENS
ncbi:molybdenum cofactor guanylyltransferase [Planctomonas psychrotolerans]|uniref:molybdenum cofactor guanylyltransferase n=1 Tax=Planctomonas psychrotolerans TaxID=2528712 RepID=UPI001239E60B|nr:NTP transferase domain-containing protein [Planctomonas psychrotolerans]